jgi:hypothetical protein
MTAQTPAPKASGVSALLASFPNPPPQAQPPPAPGADFSNVISQAVTAQGGGSTDDTSSAQNAKGQTKPSAGNAGSLDATAASLLLALLAPPLPALTQVIAKKSTSRTAHEATVSPRDEVSAPASNPETKSTKAGDAERTPAEAEETPQEQQAAAKEASALKAILSHEKSPLLSAASEQTKEVQAKATASVGTPAANTSDRMSFNAERNEIAGRTEQKLPPDAVSAVAGADTGGPSSDGGAKSSLSFAWHEAPAEPLTITDISASGGATSPLTAATAEASTSSSSSAPPLERLESMIAHEALIIRQTGAQTLGVSLKLDSNTQLYLQLTNHNGSIQASVRCERGSFAPEDAQWSQLQQSLARQNVALQPMGASSNLSFRQPSDERPRQQAQTREDWTLPGTAVQPVPPRIQQKEQSRSSRNWESWA